MIDALGKAKRSKQFPCTHLRVATLAAKDHLRDDDILKRREFRQQLMELVDEAHLGAAHAGALVVVHPGAVAAVDDDMTLVRRLQQAGDVQQRRLARTGGADEGHRLAGRQQHGRQPLEVRMIVDPAGKGWCTDTLANC